jgi:hypothetical protein
MPIKADWLQFDLPTCRYCPDSSGVYELGYATNGLVVYIGKSNSSVKSRLMKHIERKDFIGVTHFRFRKTDEARHAEYRLLSEYRKKHGKLPKHNKSMPSNPDNDF